MEATDSIHRQIEGASKALNYLREQAARYTVLSLPIELRIEIEEKEQQVDSLQLRLAQMEGSTPKGIAENLPRRIKFIGRSSEIKQCLANLGAATVRQYFRNYPGRDRTLSDSSDHAQLVCQIAALGYEPFKHGAVDRRAIDGA